METCLDFTLPLTTRLEHLVHLTEEDKDNLIERMCSVYNIHPTFMYLEYIQALILQPGISLRRRLRVADMCDLGRMVLYLLGQINNTNVIQYIEILSNPYLKHHAYEVLYSKTDSETRIQILKNLYRLEHLKKVHFKFLDWFLSVIDNIDYDYKLRANCADFILLHAPKDSLYYKTATQFLNLDSTNEIYSHRENVHLFTPKPEAITSLLNKTIKSDMDTILSFATEYKFDTDLLVKRIVNDKTLLGTDKHTLCELICAVWPELTDDLKRLLLSDIQESRDEWMCTTGYYNRIISIYQSVHDNSYLIETSKLDEYNFTQSLILRINRHLLIDECKEDILLELPHSSEEFRIKYLTFRVNTLPSILEDMKSEFSHLTPETFDEYFSRAIRIYECA